MMPSRFRARVATRRRAERPPAPSAALKTRITSPSCTHAHVHARDTVAPSTHSRAFETLLARARASEFINSPDAIRRDS
jgi:hypothetical protein